MQADQSQQFNARLNQWVAAQGFWFQIRHSVSGGGSKRTAIYHLLSMGFKVFLLLVVVGAGTGYYLASRSKSKGFQKSLSESIKSGLTASKAEVTSPAKKGNELWIRRFVAEGGAKTFFNCLEAKNVRCQMGLLSGIWGKWDTGTVLISRLEMELRAGADDEASALSIANAFFKKSSTIAVDSLEIDETSLFWGYSAHTRGSIENSHLMAQRSDDQQSWKLKFKGGKFSQGWLNQLDIVDLLVVCSPQGVFFEKAEFRHHDGTVDLTGLRLIGGARPTIEGIAKVRKLDLSTVLPTAPKEFVEGSLSGDFKITGSTNSSEGVGFAGTANFDGQDNLVLRDQLPLLKALSIIDYSRDYRQITFINGSFHLKSTNGKIEINDLNLKTGVETELGFSKKVMGETIILSGHLKARPPTKAETTKPQAGEQISEDASPFSELTTANKSENQHDTDIATVVSNGSKANQLDIANSLTARVARSLDAIRNDSASAEKLTKLLRYEGSFQMSLLPNAFERAPELIKKFPVDPETNRISIAVEIDGPLETLTFQQAQEIYRQGRR